MTSVETSLKERFVDEIFFEKLSTYDNTPSAYIEKDGNH